MLLSSARLAVSSSSLHPFTSSPLLPVSSPPSPFTSHTSHFTPLNSISPWMTGSCIEDVNHEIYGGLYAQMIFGESFEEPPPFSLPGWSVYGGQWHLDAEGLHVQPDAGAKLVRDAPILTDGRVDCDVRLDDDTGNNAGLILRVQNPRTGADTWTGYEISINRPEQIVLLGRHRENWQPLLTAPATITTRQWHHLRVDLNGSHIQIFLDNAAAPAIAFTDTTAPILSGRVGIRTWQSHASYRNLQIHAAGGPVIDDPLGTADLAGDAAPMEVSGMWDAFHAGTPAAEYHWDAGNPFNTAHSQEIILRTPLPPAPEAGGSLAESAPASRSKGSRGMAGEGLAGIANRGLNRWGLTFRRGRTYAGYLYLRQQGYTGRVTVALQNKDGSRTYAQQRLSPVGEDWKRYNFSLRSSDTDTNARFALWIDRPGAVWVDQVYLSGTGSDLFHGLPIRADIANGLVSEGITFLRYAGSMVNAPEYRWKKMIGDRALRPQYHGTWYPYSTNGFGIEEFVQFCRAAHIEPAFAINIEETPQDAADLVEYLNGTASSPWGRKRSQNGHPQPYGVRFIEIGNEETTNEHYLERFKLLEAAIHRQDPALNLVIAAWWDPDNPVSRRIVQELNGKAALWDVHIGGDNLNDGPAADAIFTRMETLVQQWAPGTPLKACVFEENGGLHDLQRALGHARILNATRRHGDFVLIDCPANCLQPWQQNDNGWDQGQLFFTSSQIWGAPPYYVQQMIARNYQPIRIQATADNPNLDILATRSQDSSTLVYQIVNPTAQPQSTTIQAASQKTYGSMEVWEIGGDLKDVNTPENPEHIVPRETAVHLTGPDVTHTFPPYSFTVLRLHK